MFSVHSRSVCHEFIFSVHFRFLAFACSWIFVGEAISYLDLQGFGADLHVLGSTYDFFFSAGRIAAPDASGAIFFFSFAFLGFSSHLAWPICIWFSDGLSLVLFFDLPGLAVVTRPTDEYVFGWARIDCCAFRFGFSFVL